MNEIDEKKLILERQLQWAALQKPIKIESSTYILAPKDFELKNITSELESQDAIEQHMQLHNIDCFCSYVNKYRQTNTMVVINNQSKKIRASIDYHGAENKELCLHSAEFLPELSKDWLTWINNNKKKFSQYDFALFIEDQVESISEPSGAEMLEIATHFKVIRKAHFSKGVNLNSGEIQFSFSNENQQGTISVPSEFKVALPVFEYGEYYELTARLRYRLSDDCLVLWYELRRPDLALDKAIESIREKLGKLLHKDVFVVMGK